VRYLAAVLLLLCCCWTAAQAQQVPTAPTNLVAGSVPRVNWSNPISQGLGFVWVTIGGLQFDLVNSQYGTYTKAGPISSDYGAATKLDGTSGPVISEGRAAIATDNPGAGTGAFSVMILANPASSSTPSRGFTQSHNNTAFVTPEFDLDFNRDITGAGSAGLLNMTEYDGTGATCVPGGPYTTVSTAGAVDGNYHVFGGQRSAADSMTLWRDGINVSSTTNTAGAPCNIRENWIGVGVYGDGANDPSSATFVINAGWNRLLSPAEWQLLTINPFQIILYSTQSLLAQLVNSLRTTGGSFMFRPF
jgi:hypothetical protein